MTFRFRGAVRFAAGLLLFSGVALGQEVDDATRGAARQLGEDGVLAFQNNDFATASQKLEKGWSLLKAPVIGLWSARALVKNGRLVEGYERYLETTRLAWSGGDATVQEKAKVDAATEAEQLRPRVPTLVVLVEGAPASDVQVRVDGTALAAALIGEARPINPGHHLVEGTRGTQTVSLSVDVAEHASKDAKLVFAAPKAATSDEMAPPARSAPAPTLTATSATSPAADGGKQDWRATAGWVTVGAGGLALGLGVVGAVLGGSKKASLDESGQCDASYRCEAGQQDTVNSYNTLRTLSSVGFIAGGALAATGLVLVLTAPSSRGQVALNALPGSVQLRARF